MHRILANASRLMSRLTGGRPGTTLCHRAAMRWGYECLFCRIVSWAIRDKIRVHCLDELTPAEIVALKRRRK